MPIIYGVIPCYNEEEVLPQSARILEQKWRTLMDAGRISPDSRIALVDDGSKDATWQIISNLSAEPNSIFVGIKLAGNKGHQNALLCGLMTCKDHCDAAISMDADLQDDIDVVDKFIEEYKNGCGIVYGVRNDRTSDSFAKRFTAEGYYKILELLGVNIVFNHADYRLMSRAALDALGQYRETNLFLRGIIPELGFKTAAMALNEDAVTIEDPNLMAEEKLAIILGTEGDGLSDQTIAQCDYTVCIPMSHDVDSLNVAAASAVAFWQLRVR